MNIQSHICEQKDEVEYTLGLFPDHEHCASIFDKNDLLSEKVCVCVYSDPRVHSNLPQRRVTYLSCPLVGILKSSHPGSWDLITLGNNCS